MGRTYVVRQRRTGVVWPVIVFFVIVGSVAQFSAPGAIIVAATIMGLGVWAALLGRRRGHGW